MQDLNLKIQEYVLKRKTDSKYQGGLLGLQVVQKVFQQYTQSVRLEEVLLKVAILNDLYHTHLTAPFKMSKHITELNSLDEMIQKGLPEAVEKIADLSMKGTSAEDIYIFATKYCFMSNPEYYFIYDPIVQQQLKKYLNLSQEEANHLKNYPFFSEQMTRLIQTFHIQANHTDLDAFLWLEGHENNQLK